MPKADSIDDSDPIKPHAAFLIRCWREANTWRFSLEDVASRGRQRCDSIEELLAALRKRMTDVVGEEGR